MGGRLPATLALGLMAVIAAAAAAPRAEAAPWTRPVTYLPPHIDAYDTRAVWTTDGHAVAVANLQAVGGLKAFVSPGAGTFAPRGTVAPNVPEPYALVSAPHGRAVVAYAGNDGVYTATSKNGGPFDVPTRIAGSKFASFPRLAAAPNGDLFASWRTYVCESGCPSTTTARVAIKPAGSDHFEAPQQLSGPGLTGGPVQIAANGRGGALAAWTSGPDGGSVEDSRLHYSLRRRGGRFGPARVLERHRGVISFRVEATPDGRAAIVWNMVGSTPIHVATGTVSAGFGRPHVLGSGRGSRGRVALGPRRTGMVAWVEGKRGRAVRVASLNRGRIGRARTLAPGPAHRLAALIDPRGRRVVVWRGQPVRSLQVATAAAGHPFTQPVTLASRGARYFSLRSTTRGLDLVVWETTPPYGPISPHFREHVHTAIARPGRPFGPAQQLDMRGGPGGFGGHLETGPAGKAFVIYGEDTRGGDEDTRLIRYLRR